MILCKTHKYKELVDMEETLHKLRPNRTFPIFNFPSYLILIFPWILFIKKFMIFI
jgi:hypothetical protein